jgi:hypothetical protein
MTPTTQLDLLTQPEIYQLDITAPVLQPPEPAIRGNSADEAPPSPADTIQVGDRVTQLRPTILFTHSSGLHCYTSTPYQGRIGKVVRIEADIAFVEYEGFEQFPAHPKPLSVLIPVLDVNLAN